jgi:succinate-semialdehyde dehydrogenase/glutarate-semialdehyde dehydrogenase
MTFHSINPTNGEPFANYEEWQPREVQDVIGKVHDAYLAWRRVGFDQRARLMRKAAETLHKHAQNFGRLMAQEMGKPVRDGVAAVGAVALKHAECATSVATPVFPARISESSFSKLPTPRPSGGSDVA